MKGESRRRDGLRRPHEDRIDQALQAGRADGAGQP
jgi:hypothetical protein